VTIHNIKCLDYKVRGQGAFDLGIKEFTVVNDCFQIKFNEEIGLYRQTLIKKMYDYYRLTLAACVWDVLAWHSQYPGDRKKTWQLIGEHYHESL
jgi:hypothetical protein